MNNTKSFSWLTYTGNLESFEGIQFVPGNKYSVAVLGEGKTSKRQKLFDVIPVCNHIGTTYNAVVARGDGSGVLVAYSNRMEFDKRWHC